MTPCMASLPRLRRAVAYGPAIVALVLDGQYDGIQIDIENIETTRCGSLRGIRRRDRGRRAWQRPGAAQARAIRHDGDACTHRSQ